MNKTIPLSASLKKESIQELLKIVLRYIISSLPLWGAWFLDELSQILHPKIAVILILILLSILFLFLSYFISFRKKYKKEKNELIQEFEAEKLKLKSQLNELEKNPLKDYTFDKKLGIWKDDNGLYYCPACLINNIKLPMKEQENGWICVNHEKHKFYPNPDYKSPSIKVIPRRNRWMDDW